MDQATALQILQTGQNVYLTGSAGTGKTFLINQYIEYLRTRQVPLAVTASTGIAATHIGGQTIHSWSGIGIRDRITPKDLDLIGKNKQTVSRLRSTQVLIIDEISMLSGKVLTGISDILKHFRRSQEPFGGIQVLLSGDFFQLPPVSRDQLSNREKFCFMAPIWVEARLKVCYLSKQYRQGQDTLSYILTEIRSQDVSDDSLDRLREKLESPSQLEAPIKLFTHNADVDQMNTMKLQENPNPAQYYYAETKGKDQLLEGLKQTVLAGPVVEVKENARVMFVKNNPEKGYFNGSTGTITGYDEENYPIVQLDTDRLVTAKPEEWTVSDENETILASYKQIPLRLAYAITVHKSQGMTLDQAEIDLSKTFEAGQGYVALSRLKSWDGLFLKGINQTSLQLDALAVKADKRFQELSSESEDWLNLIDAQSKEIAFLDFVEKCGGTNDPEIIEKNSGRSKKYYESPKKESTFEKTAQLMASGLSLAQIAMERDLSQGTILGHIEKLLSEKPEMDLSQIKPDAKTIKKVKTAMEKIIDQAEEEFLDKDGKVRIGYIYAALNGKLDYDEIRLARLFIEI